MSKRTNKKDREERIDKIHDLLMRGKYPHSARKSPAFQLYAQDFISGTTDLSTIHIGAYFLLLLRQWDKYFVPNDSNKLSLIGKCSSEVIDIVLEKFVMCSDGKYRNSRLERIRAEQIDNKSSKSKGGITAMKNRWRETEQEKPEEKSPATLTDNGPHYFYIGTEIFKMKISDYMKEHMQIYLNAWGAMHGKSVNIETVWARMEQKIGKAYNGAGHIQNMFESLATEIRQEKITGKTKNAGTVLKAALPKKNNATL